MTSWNENWLMMIQVVVFIKLASIQQDEEMTIINDNEFNTNGHEGQDALNF